MSTMPGTITVDVSTRDELRRYKRGDVTTYDEVITAMLNEVDPEEVVEYHE